MGRDDRKQALFESALTKVELLAVLRHALNLRYRRLCNVARADWERLFGNDPADSCVNVRVEPPSAAARGSGLLKSRSQPASKAESKSSVPSFVH
jgi:hypothetical protein